MRILAPAKLNLALHVTGRRSDGYHLLDMLVSFADEAAADVVHAQASDEDSFTVTGPFGVALADTPQSANLVLKARNLYRSRFGLTPLAITLEKNLPVASGVGGGSADAAATLLACATLAGAAPGLDHLVSAGLSLGADVPMCLVGKPARVSGVGDIIAPVANFPSLAAVLVNPGTAVATASAFAALARRDHAPLPDLPAGTITATAITDWLGAQTRNDLFEPAAQIAPVIVDVLAALSASGAQFARMSGSGATCFGLYGNRETAQNAASAIRTSQPDWWVTATTLKGSEPETASR